MKNKYIQLHVHSHYSTLDALASPEQIVKKTVELGLPGVAITDHGNMNAFGYHYQCSKKAGIKPLLGCEFYFIPDLAKWKKQIEKVKEDENLTGKEKKEKYKIINKRYHLILLAKNQIGFENLNMLVHEAYKNFYYRSRIDRELLETYSKGIICSSACIAGEVQQAVLQDKTIKQVSESIDYYKSIFGDDYYLELQFNELDEQHKSNEALLDYSKKHKIKTIVTTDMHYLNKRDQQTHQTLLLMNSKSTYEDLRLKREMPEMNTGAWEFECKELYYKTYDELWESAKRWKYRITKKQFDDSCANTFEIFHKIEDFEIDTGVKLKDMNPKIKDKEEHLSSLCKKSLSKMGLSKNKEYVNRMNFEIDVITKKKLANYFLVVSEIVKHAKYKMKMLVGCGRGSGGGSLVNYLMEITDLDPIKHGLYFERFLAVDRKDYPDIDIDFEYNDEVKKWLVNKYPNETACITSYSTFQLFGLLKDLGRTYGIEDPRYFDILNKAVRSEVLDNFEADEDRDRFAAITYDEAISSSESLVRFLKSHQDINDDMKILMNKIRHVGRHAAGVVICDDLIKKQPTMIKKDVLQTSLSEGTKDKLLADYGFVKIDVLGLKTLRVIHDAIKLVAKKRGDSEEEVYAKIKADKINLSNKKVYKNVFHNLNLLGIFQFETDNIKSMVVKTHPTDFDDLCAMNALFRPGPLASGFAFEYGDRKKGKIDIHYFDSDIVERILKPTFGILVYQEQMMELGHYLGKLTLAETNVLRKLLVKANKVEGDLKAQLEDMKKRFVKGSKENGVKKESALKIWQLMENFSGYGFNKAHAVGYAMIAYQCAYIKAYYPIEFYTALLNNEDFDNYDKIVKEAKRNKIKVNTLNINKSGIKFKIVDDEIYWGFSKVKGIGEKASTTIVENTDIKEIKSFEDFLCNTQIKWRTCNKKVVETMLRIGVFDFDNNDRAYLLELYKNYQAIKNKLLMKDRQTEKGRNGTYLKAQELTEKNVNDIEEIIDVEKSEMELELYGVNIDYSIFHINGREKKIKHMIRKSKAGGFQHKYEYTVVRFRDVVIRKDRKGKNMAFLEVEDIYGIREQAIIFSSNFVKNDQPKNNNIYCIIFKRNDKLFIDEYINIDEIYTEEDLDG